MVSNPKPRFLAVNGNAGAFVDVTVSVNGCHYMEITECPPNAGQFAASPFNPQGLNVEYPDDNFTAQFAFTPGDVIPFGNKDAMGHPGQGRGLGLASRVDNSNPGGPNVPAAVLCKIRSATATATQVMIREWI